MPAATAVPGIKFEFAQPPRAPVEVRTDIVGFVGFTERGPFHRATRIESWQQFESVFGGCSAPGFLPLAVHAFFSTGGRTCYVVRVLVPPDSANAGSAAYAFIELPLPDGGGATGRRLRLTADSPGSWGNQLSIEIVPRLVELRGTTAFRFLMVVRDGSGGLWRLVDCSLDPDDTRFLPYVISSLPDLPIRLAARHTGAPNEEIRMRSAADREWKALPTEGLTGSDQPFERQYRLRAGRWEFSGGRDGVAGCTVKHLIGERDALGEENSWGLLALMEVDEIGIIAIPDAAPFPRRPKSPLRPPKPADCTVLHPAPVPSSSAPAEPTEYPPQWETAEMVEVANAAIYFCELRRDCVALLDTPPDRQTPRQVEEYRDEFDTSFAGLYWPWLLVDRNPRGPRALRADPREGEFGRLQPPESALRADPIGLRAGGAASTGALIAIPPSGMVAGLTAAADLLVGPHRTPAGQTARDAIAVTVVVSDDEHGMLNARGVNVFRERIGRGVVLEGARSLSAMQRVSSPWRHLNVRRVMLAICEAIDERTQWAVFEPNNPLLWADLRDVLRAFLTQRWRLGWLSGRTDDEAYYVRCDRSTNPPESVERGFIVAEIGLRFPPPIEWIVVHIGRSNVRSEILDVERA
ncbi:MAG: phage tail sheath subtilisin-like domain-containing protein [Gemmatimonadota bacterium]